MPKWLDLPGYRGLYLVVLDVFGMILCAELAIWLRTTGSESLDIRPALLFAAAVNIIILYAMNVYYISRQSNALQLMLRSVIAVAISTVVIGMLIYFFRGARYAPLFWRSILLLAMSLFAVWAALSRYYFCVLVRWLTRRHRWLVLGTDHIAKAIHEDVMATGNILEFYPIFDHDTMTGPDSELFSSISQFRSRFLGVVLSKGFQPDPEVMNWLVRARLQGIKIFSATDFFEKIVQRLPAQELEDQWFVFSTGFDLVDKDISFKIKRMIDIILALFGLILTFPVMIIVALAIKLTDGGPVIFSQLRTGTIGKPYRLYKFRSMVVDAESSGPQWAVENDHRITTVGRFLRNLRLDELPQLWNVLQGSMSLVGPRPERPEFTRELEARIPYYDMRYVVKPGITGWAQVRFPYGASVEDAEQKLAFDLYYIKNYSLTLDLYILLRTIRIVVTAGGR